MSLQPPLECPVDTASRAPFTVWAGVRGPRAARLIATGRLVGEAAATCLAAALEQQLLAGSRHTRLDLSGVPMLDRAGCDVLVAGHHRFLAADATLVLAGIGPRIARLLALTGLDQTLFTTTTEPGRQERDVQIR